MNKTLVDKLFIYSKGNLINRSSDEIIGCADKDGYLVVGVNFKQYKVHRLIFLMHHGYLPAVLDHINGDTSDNRIDNLRACNKSQNACNSKIRSDNTSGVKGVCWKKGRGKWRAYIQVKGKQLHLGHFDDLELAELVVSEARELYHGKFARQDNKHA